MSTTVAAGTSTADDHRMSHIRSLYASYFFAAWGDRMWEFAAIVFLLEIFPHTLLPPSIFGFAEAAAGIVFGPYIGQYIDSNDRLKVIRSSIYGQNSVIVVASVLFAYTLFHVERSSMGMKQSVVALIVLAGMVAKVTSSLNKISIHKDWVVVITVGDSEFRTKVNSVMRRVDLTCSILAPMLVGLLSWQVGPPVTCVFIAIWATCSIFVEVRLNSKVYDQVSALQQPKAPKPTSDPNDDSGTKKEEGSTNCLGKTFRNLDRFRSHPAFDVSVPYCVLYMSVLSFGGIMVGYLRTLGVNDVLLATGRAMAALVAIGSTFVLPKMIASMGLVKTGMITLLLQVLCLAPLAGIFLIFDGRFEIQQQVWYIAIIFITVCLSRFGLWGFDIAQTQMMQNMVEPHQVGAINGAQETLMNFCWLISYVFTMIFSDPRDFTYPVLLSFSAISTSSGLFFLYYRSHQKDEEEGRRSENDTPSPSRPKRPPPPLATDAVHAIRGSPHEPSSPTKAAHNRSTSSLSGVAV